jgi:hypothetical protein
LETDGLSGMVPAHDVNAVLVVLTLHTILSPVISIRNYAQQINKARVVGTEYGWVFRRVRS